MKNTKDKGLKIKKTKKLFDSGEISAFEYAEKIEEIYSSIIYEKVIRFVVELLPQDITDMDDSHIWGIEYLLSLQNERAIKIYENYKKRKQFIENFKMIQSGTYEISKLSTIKNIPLILDD